MDTRTYEDFYKYVGVLPARLGVVSRMYDNLTATFLTEGLRNVIYQEGGVKSSANKYQSLNAMLYTWEITTNYIKRIEFAAQPEGDGAGGTDIVMAFRERYYQKNDTFKIEKSGQQCYVLTNPIRKDDHYWEVTVRLISHGFSDVLNKEACLPGDKTMWISAHMPELHDEGWTKWQSNVERHIGYIQTHRFDISYSAQYAALENVFLRIGEDKGNGYKESIYKMDTVQKTLLDTFLTGRNNALLFSKGNVDPKTNKPTISDTEGRPIYISDGLIPQAEAYGSKYVFNKLTINTLKTAISALSEKSENPTGNHYVFICNEAGWQQIGDVLEAHLSNYHTDGTFLWSMKANDYVSVGAKGFDSYNYQGNTISFHVDRTFSREFGYDKAYFLALDLTADKTSAQPPLAMFTLKNGEMITNKYKGVGGFSGLESGEVSSPVAGSKLIMWGYSSLALFNPYRTYIMRQA